MSSVLKTRRKKSASTSIGSCAGGKSSCGVEISVPPIVESRLVKIEEKGSHTSRPSMHVCGDFVIPPCNRLSDALMTIAPVHCLTTSSSTRRTDPVRLDQQHLIESVPAVPGLFMGDWAGEIARPVNFATSLQRAFSLLSLGLLCLAVSI